MSRKTPKPLTRGRSAHWTRLLLEQMVDDTEVESLAEAKGTGSFADDRWRAASNKQRDNNSPTTTEEIMTKSTYSDEEIRELIAQRAYEIYLQRGDGAGDEFSDWLTAEAEVLARQAAVSRPVRTVEDEAPAKAAKPKAKKGARESRPTPGLA